MSNPIHTLKHEHRVIELGLRALNGMCVRLGSGQRIPPAVLRQLLDFIRTFADQYHHWKEETHFFPALERRGIRRKDGPLEVLTNQHRMERRLSADLCLAFDAYTKGVPDASERFISSARRYTDLMVDHMEREDHILFRLADEILDDADKAALAKLFHETETVLGTVGLEEYERIAAELEGTWAI